MHQKFMHLTPACVSQKGSVSPNSPTVLCSISYKSYYLLPISHSLQSHAKPHTFAENHQNHRLLYNDFGESDRNKLMISEVKITDTANDKDNQTRMRKPVTRRRRRHRLRKPKKSQDKWTALVGKLFFLSIHFTV